VGGAPFVVKLFSTRKTMQNKGGTTMSKNNVISLENPEGNTDALRSLLRSGARELITKAVQTELAEFLSQYQDMTDSEGRPLVVRNGYLPEREIMTGIGLLISRFLRPETEVGKVFILGQSCYPRISSGQRV
jgi:hypothetical protein